VPKILESHCKFQYPREISREERISNIDARDRSIPKAFGAGQEGHLREDDGPLIAAGGAPAFGFPSIRAKDHPLYRPLQTVQA